MYNFPNPFNGGTYFTFKSSVFPIEFTISIFDLNGIKINEIQESCYQSFCSTYWNGNDLNNKEIISGTYIYSLKLENNDGIFQKLYKITKLK